MIFLLYHGRFNCPNYMGMRILKINVCSGNLNQSFSIQTDVDAFFFFFLLFFLYEDDGGKR
jgi:hypothetical protein